MANSQIVKRYTTNKICCLATNTVKTDRKIRYGSADALCCVAKDFRAQVFLKMLQCSPETTNTTWYHGTVIIKYDSEFPPEYDFASDLIITTGSVVIESNDGTQSTTPLSFKGNYGILPDIGAVSEAFAKKIDDWGKSQKTSTIFAFAYFDDTKSHVIEEFYYDSSWGNNTDKLPKVSNIAGIGLTPFDTTATLVEIVEDNTITSSACFTEAQLCVMKRTIDNYCKNCN